MIKIEKINGTLLLIGAEDDVLWDTAKYIRRMKQRMKEHPHTCRLEYVIYEHGTHFVFPESMLKTMLQLVLDFSETGISGSKKTSERMPQ